MFLRIAVFLQLFFLSLMATTTDNKATEKISDLSKTFTSASDLFMKSDNTKGPVFTLIIYAIVVIGLIFMGAGINDTFIAEDRGGENKKGKGVMKIIGGALFVSITLLYNFISGNT